LAESTDVFRVPGAAKGDARTEAVEFCLSVQVAQKVRGPAFFASERHGCGDGKLGVARMAAFRMEFDQPRKVFLYLYPEAKD